MLWCCHVRWHILNTTLCVMPLACPKWRAHHHHYSTLGKHKARRTHTHTPPHTAPIVTWAALPTMCRVFVFNSSSRSFGKFKHTQTASMAAAANNKRARDGGDSAQAARDRLVTQAVGLRFHPSVEEDGALVAYLEEDTQQRNRLLEGLPLITVARHYLLVVREASRLCNVRVGHGAPACCSLCVRPGWHALLLQCPRTRQPRTAHRHTSCRAACSRCRHGFGGMAGC